MRAGRSCGVLRGLLAALLLCCVVPAPQAADSVSEQELKAAYLLNFLRFTHWPQRPPERPVEVLVVGPPRLASALRRLARAPGQQGQAAIVVRRIDRRDISSAALDRALRDADAVYVASETWPDPEPLLGRLRHRPVLTIGDGHAFVENGGMLSLVREQRRIAFDANPQAIRDSGLQLSAKVLKLARIVAPPGGA